MQLGLAGVQPGLVSVLFLLAGGYSVRLALAVAIAAVVVSPAVLPYWLFRQLDLLFQTAAVPALLSLSPPSGFDWQLASVALPVALVVRQLFSCLRPLFDFSLPAEF